MLPRPQDAGASALAAAISKNCGLQAQLSELLGLWGFRLRQTAMLGHRRARWQLHMRMLILQDL